MENTKVVVKNLTKKYDDLLVLNDISFSVKKGEFLVLVGPTGCGKTTFLNSLTKIIDINKGQILIDDEPVDPKKHDLAYILQEYSTMPWLTVEQNIGYGLKIKGWDKKAIKKKVDEVIDVVHLGEFRKFYPGELSLGMARRAALARAFAVLPDLLILDEPFVSLDDANAQRLRGLLLTLWQSKGCTALMVTHNVKEAAMLADKILVLSARPTTKIAEIEVDVPQAERDTAYLDEISEKVRQTGLVELPQP
mgnify:CR=1 FL=1